MDQSYSPCSICGIFMRKGSQKNKHQNTHTNIFGWQCSVCGGRFDTKRDRKRHENSNQLSKLFNVGFRLVDVQELARSSQASRIRPDNRDATIEELRCIMRSNPQEPKKVSKQSHSTLRAPKREQVEALRLDDSDDENDRWESKSLPEPSTRSIPVSMSISTGFVANNPPQPEEEKEQSKENLVMLELIKKPQFLYYDYKTFTEFTTNFVSFGKFTERVNEMGFRSAVVIANELDHGTIRHLKSPRFLIP
ncbi:hypothetical protein M3Y96_00591600 [Aphelenchoides besseyi]|nr:hypothetical protein M3Y96_00591600 [Aphelenchoides besseyi]